MQFNKPRLAVLFIFCLLITSLTVQAQDEKPKKYPSLLWEITGNGLSKPSYMYGTMHVSSKLAFHLGDTFFMALERCDNVALESDATTWLKQMFGEAYLEQTGGLYRSGLYYRDFYRDAFKVDEIDKRVIGASLNFNNRIINGMLYRKSNYAADFEEETYLDMYIHQAGKKLNKNIIGLEDFMESQMLVQKSEVPDPDEKDKPKNLAYRKLIQQGKRPNEMLEDAYRAADLDMVDSIQRIMNPSINHQKYMLHERNANMVEVIDSIVQSGQTLFSGVGAAHLAGEKGMIEMLREKGYNVRPITRNIGSYSKNYRDKLEKTYVGVQHSKYQTSDGWIEVNVPDKLFEMPANDYYKMYFYPDMSNGTTYSLIRLRYHGQLRNQTKEYMVKRIDSLLYESIPGDIDTQISITRNGYPGFDIINKTKKGDYQRCIILTTPIEMIVFKVGGTLDYLKDNDYLNEVFESFQIVGQTGAWEHHKSPYGFEVDLPSTPVTDDKNTAMMHLWNNVVNITSTNGTDYYSVKRASYHDQSYIEEDTFELSYIATQFQDEMKHKEINRSFFKFDGMTAMKSLAKDSNGYVHTVYAIDGPRYYQLLARTSDTTWPDKFFNSFKRTTSTPIRSYFTVEDTSYFYTVESNTKRANYAAFDLEAIKKRIENKDNDRNYDGTSEYIYYSDLTADDEVYLFFRQFSRYFYRPSYDSLWRGERNFYVRKGMVIEKDVISKDSSIFDLVLSDTNSTRLLNVRYKVNGGILYVLRYINEEGRRSTFGERFFNSFKPQADTVVGRPFNQNKGDLFFADLYGTDSLQKDYALKNVNGVSFDKKHVDQIIETIESFKHEDFGIQERVHLIIELGHLKHRRILDYLTDVYERSVDTAQLQIAVLQALVNQRSKPGTRLFNRLLDSETPLTSPSTIENLMQAMSDSLELYNELFPFLLKFTRYPEYQEGVYVLMAEMLDSNVLRPKDYKAYRKDLVREAKDALKRVMAESHDDNGSKSSYRYGYNYVNHSDLIEAYNKLLIPFNSNKEVQEYFNRIRRLNSKPDLLNSSIQMAAAGMEVNDTIWSHFGADPTYLIRMYRDLEDVQLTNLIPDSCLAQVRIAKSLLYQYIKLTDDDSVQFIKRIPAANKNGKGYVYIFKKKDKYNENEWDYDYVGILPLDSTEIVTRTDVKSTGNNYLDDEDLDEKMKDAVEGLLYADRKRVKEKRRQYGYYGY